MALSGRLVAYGLSLFIHGQTIHLEETVGTPASCMRLVILCLNENDPIMMTDNKQRHEGLSTTTLNVILLTRLMFYYERSPETIMWRIMDREVIKLQYSRKFRVPSRSESSSIITCSAMSFCMRHIDHKMHAL